MLRRLAWPLLVATGLAVPLTGCETLRSGRRSNDSDDATTWKKDPATDTSKIPSVDSDSNNPRPFFKNDRRSGGWSSEAREIERDLGVGS
jgi:hypothetical protein